ncbi:hypothetical protein QA641_19075 [Bradyrhizobium sp. CB1650]|uniref:hypothetical protein n=1 Tax=Bradyrhizobium sp. CB1650 TaxID=3039153 RepID=UPI0024356000|nr:hypothetical protein [Bradyrhizobium sp. CB1650]WGD55800.1 hypothetical protein QA641_19075 [Bradyrhizobium sp. CB1650]
MAKPSAMSSATVSIKALIVICGIAAMPAASLAQGTSGAAGSSSGGVANAPAPPPGTNSLGTAQSSGPNAAPGVTTGTGSASVDATVQTENRQLDKKMKSICRGC